jgi:hypothetical protein
MEKPSLKNGETLKLKLVQCIQCIQKETDMARYEIHS